MKKIQKYYFPIALIFVGFSGLYVNTHIGLTSILIGVSISLHNHFCEQKTKEIENLHKKEIEKLKTEYNNKINNEIRFNNCLSLGTVNLINMIKSYNLSPEESFSLYKKVVIAKKGKKPKENPFKKS